MSPEHRRRSHSASGRWSRFAWGAAWGVPLVAVISLGASSAPVWAGLDCGLYVAATSLVMAALCGKAKLIWHPLYVPMLGFGVLVALQAWRGGSVYPGATLTGFLQLAGCGCLFLLAIAGLRSHRRLWRTAIILWWFAAALAVEAIAQAFTANRWIYWVRPARYATPIGPFIYHNHFAAAMDLLLPLSVAVTLLRRGGTGPAWQQLIRRGLVPALCLASVLVSESRGGVLALLFELGVALVLYWPSLRRHRRQRRLAALGAAAMLAFALLANSEAILSRFESLGSHDVSAIMRWEVARSAVAIWEAYPWGGSGFNTFASVYPQFQRVDDGLHWQYAHDDYAQILAETGLLGAACVLLFLALLLVDRKRSQAHADGRVVDLQKAAFIGVAGFLFHAFGDFVFHNHADALLFFLFLAMAVSRVAPASSHAPASHEAHRGRRSRADLLAGHN